MWADSLLVLSFLHYEAASSMMGLKGQCPPTWMPAATSLGVQGASVHTHTWPWSSAAAFPEGPPATLALRHLPILSGPQAFLDLDPQVV